MRTRFEIEEPLYFAPDIWVRARLIERGGALARWALQSGVIESAYLLPAFALHVARVTDVIPSYRVG